MIRPAHSVSAHRRLDIGILFAVAVAVRLLALARSPGGFGGLVGYDAGVYYAGAESLTFGHLPYRDFILLHPPAMLLVLVPFAGLGRLAGDLVGFQVTEVAFAFLGAINACLVVLTGRRLGWARHAVLTGGFCYALWYPAVVTESSARLEPLGGMFLLASIFVLARTGTTRLTTRRAYAVGLLATAACMVKIWWIVPLIVLGAWIAVHTRRVQQVGAYAAGAATCALVVAGPFFAAAPAAMWRMIVLDQIGRHRASSAVDRLYAMTELRQILATGSILRPLALAAVVVALLVLTQAAARNGGTLPVILAATQLAVLFVAPVYVDSYASFVAGPLALMVSAAIPLQTGRLLRPVIAVSVASAVVATAYALAPPHRPPISIRFPGDTFTDNVRDVRCVISDSPMVLIRMNVLTRNFEHNCANWIDVTGAQYERDIAGRGRYIPAEKNPRWQRSILRYLTSGDAFVIGRKRISLSKDSEQRLGAYCVLARGDSLTLYRTATTGSSPTGSSCLTSGH